MERFEVCQNEGFGADEIILMISASEAHNPLNFRMTTTRRCASTPLSWSAPTRWHSVIGCAGTVYGCPVRGDLTTDEVIAIVKFYIDEGAQTIMLGDTTGAATRS